LDGPFFILNAAIYDLHLPAMNEAFWQLIAHPSIEWIITGLNIVFLLLVINENILCWPFGIVASILSVLIFLSPDVQLYSEALLYSVYVVLGVYAWINWRRSSAKDKMPIRQESYMYHGVLIAIGLIMWAGLAKFFSFYTDSQMPWADAFSTSFAFIATYLEAQKVLRSWVYWIIINAFSVWLYQARDLHVLSYMMIGFAIFSVVGFYKWSNSYKLQAANALED
jgi:nicotinamide mononucleotide transporter